MEYNAYPCNASVPTHLYTSAIQIIYTSLHSINHQYSLATPWLHFYSLMWSMQSSSAQQQVLQVSQTITSWITILLSRSSSSMLHHQDCWRGGLHPEEGGGHQLLQLYVRLYLWEDGRTRSFVLLCCRGLGGGLWWSSTFRGWVLVVLGVWWVEWCLWWCGSQTTKCEECDYVDEIWIVYTHSSCIMWRWVVELWGY